MSAETAVILLQMGGPDSLDAVKPFLLNLFTDRDIIKIGPAVLQPLIARFIVRKRSPKVIGYYEKIGGRSPIRELTEAQALPWKSGSEAATAASSPCATPVPQPWTPLPPPERPGVDGSLPSPSTPTTPAPPPAPASTS